MSIKSDLVGWQVANNLSWYTILYYYYIIIIIIIIITLICSLQSLEVNKLLCVGRLTYSLRICYILFIYYLFLFVF